MKVYLNFRILAACLLYIQSILGCVDRQQPLIESAGDSQRQVRSTTDAASESGISTDESSPIIAIAVNREPDESMRPLFPVIKAPRRIESDSESGWWAAMLDRQRDAEYGADAQAPKEFLMLMLKRGVQQDCAPWRMPFVRVLMEDHEWLMKLSDLDRQAVVKLLQLGAIRLNPELKGEPRWKTTAWNDALLLIKKLGGGHTLYYQECQYEVFRRQSYQYGILSEEGIAEFTRINQAISQRVGVSCPDSVQTLLLEASFLTGRGDLFEAMQRLRQAMRAVFKLKLKNTYHYYEVLLKIATAQSSVRQWNHVINQLRTEPLHDANGPIPEGIRLELLECLANAELGENELEKCSVNFAATEKLIARLEGKESLSMAFCMLSQGQVLLRQKRLEDGREKIDAASCLLQRLIGKDNYLNQHRLLCEAEVKAAEGKLDDAKDLLESAIEQSSAYLGPENPRMLELYQAYATTLTKMGSTGEASLYENKIARIQKRFALLQDVWQNFDGASDE